MKKVMLLLVLGIFMISFAFAVNGDRLRDGTGDYHDGVVAAGGQNRDDDLMQERRENALEARMQIKEGNYDIDGRRIRIEERDENRLRLNSEGVDADTRLELAEENARLRARLSNGRNAEIKIMPDRASETALQRLRIKNCNESNNCSIELKEVGSGEQIRAAYELRAEKRAKLFGLFQAKMRVESQVDAETGEVIQERRPWWSFMASEEDETEEVEDATEETSE